MELERKNFLLRYRSSCLAEQFHSDASLEAVDRRVPINSKNWSWMTEGSLQHDTTATGVLMSASPIRGRLLYRGLRARVPFFRIPLTANHRAWQADWHQIAFSV
ncbi:hypothetical protein TNCV_2901171 [Trichonephila clavipes]|nr:hypothetical protein TNCV_2901171 [Trichonephila clavipes]